jgi:hypothetical protein
MRNLLPTALIGALCLCASVSLQLAVAQEGVIYSTSVSNNLFSYPDGEYKAGSSAILTPSIQVPGGAFSYKRITEGPGMISLNTKSGQIKLSSSDPGSYNIIYNIAKQSQTARIEIY